MFLLWRDQSLSERLPDGGGSLTTRITRARASDCYGDSARRYLTSSEWFKIERTGARVDPVLPGRPEVWVHGRRAYLSTLSVLGFGPVYEWAEDYPKDNRCDSDTSDEPTPMPYPPAPVAVPPKEKEVQVTKVRFEESPRPEEVLPIGQVVTPGSRVEITKRVERQFSTTGIRRWKSALEFCKEIGRMRGITLRLTTPGNPYGSRWTCAEGPRGLVCRRGPWVEAALGGTDPRPTPRRP